MSAQLLKQFISSLQQDVQRLDQLSQLLEQQYELMSQRSGEALQQLLRQWAAGQPLPRAARMCLCR